MVNAVVRMVTRKTVGRAMKPAKYASSKRKWDGTKKGSAKGKKGPLVSLPEVGDQGGVYVGF